MAMQDEDDEGDDYNSLQIWNTTNNNDNSITNNNNTNINNKDTNTNHNHNNHIIISYILNII